MYNSACGAAATTGSCIETDRDCQSLISKEPPAPAVEHDYSGFDIVKATQVIIIYSNVLCDIFSLSTNGLFVVWRI